jgi:cytochrome P450
MQAALKERPAIAPGPRASLLMGNIEEYMRDPIAMLMRAQRDYGDVVRNRLGPYLTHLVAHPDHVRHVLQTNYGNYIRGRFYDNFKPFFGEGLLTTDGQFWLNHRRLVQPLFHRGHVQQSSRQITSSVAVMLDRWQAYSDSGQDFDVVPDMMWLTLSVLGKMIFGVDVAHLADVIAPAVQYGVAAMMPQGNVNDFLPRWLPTPHNRRIERARRTLAGVMQWVRTERQEGTGGESDLTSLLLSAADDRRKTALTPQEVEDEMMTIFLAGHETTGSGLAWSLYALATHPEIRLRLEYELSRTLDGRAPAADDLPNLPYLCMVIDECLRVFPPIWGFTRDAAADDEIGGYHIPAGSSVFVSPYVTHRHPAFWDDPETFDPERFTPAQTAARPRFAYFPFGGGPRQCIGLHMAKLQMQLAVAMIVQRYHFAVVPGHPIERGANVSLRPVHGIRMTLRRRSAREHGSVHAVVNPAETRGAAGCPFAGQL